VMNESAVIVPMNHKKSIAWLAVLSLAACLLAFSIGKWSRHSAPVHASAAVNYPREIARINFAAAGDVIPHQAVTQAAAAQKDIYSPAPASTVGDPKDAGTS